MISTAMAAAAAFNLVCSGSVETASTVDAGVKPYQATYRIDLDKMLWCEGPCRARHPVAEVQPTSIYLQNENSDTPSEKKSLLNSISRTDGKHSILSSSKTYGRFGYTVMMIYKGQCERADFTGFPEFETKF